MQKQAITPAIILIDLDGTLVDTAPDIVAATNCMLADLHAPALPFDLVSSFIGKGVTNLVGCVLNVSELDSQISVKAAEAIFFKHYRVLNGSLGKVYPGVIDGLQVLKKQGFRLACVTNKPFLLAQDLLRITGLADYFELLVAGDSLPQMKPAAEPLLHACARLNGSAEHALMVGDSAVDCAAAKAAGIPVVIVKYGYPGTAGLSGLECDALIQTFIEIPDHFISLKNVMQSVSI